MDLVTLGWSDQFALGFEPHDPELFDVARVASQHKHFYRLYTQIGEVLAEVTGKFRHEATTPADFPCVGDWVLIQNLHGMNQAAIHHILPRKSQFSRKVAGSTTDVQMIAANIDTAFLVCGLDHDFNLRRIERYLVMIWESGASPVLVLNKVDLCEHIDQLLHELNTIAVGVPVVLLSALQNQGLEGLSTYLKTGETVALLGSSGVGKSTLTNQLMGKNLQAVQAVRVGDSHGRHTTSHRQLLCLPSGGLLIDTPGMRELQLWSAEDGLPSTFSDISVLVSQCRFRDCQHRQEPGCAIQAALDDGSLDPLRFQSYQKLRKEEALLLRKQDQKAQLNSKAQWKQITKSMRQRKKG